MFLCKARNEEATQDRRMTKDESKTKTIIAKLKSNDSQG